MDDNTFQWAPVGLERFGHLEDKISQTVEEIKAIRKEADDLRAENGRLDDRINEQIKENESLRGEIDRLTQIAGEYEKLLGENENLKQQIATLRQSETETLELLAQFEREREEMRVRVEKTLVLLTSLDAR